MRLLPPLIVISALAAPATAHAREPFVAEFRLVHGSAVTANAWREDDDVFVDAATLTALGLTPPPGSGPYRLQDIDGASIAFNEAEAAVDIACTAACFARTDLRGRAPHALALALPSTGFFLNTDANALTIEDTTTLGAAFELGAFGPWGLLEATWLSAGVRLDTRLTIDDVSNRTRLTLGDAFTRSGVGAHPFRFAGAQWGTDFSLDPSFVTFPTLALSAEAAAPAVVDVYIDDALRFRGEAPAGPFAIEDAPVIAGAGVARMVVTDVLGRQQIIAQPFYASPVLLRPGLADFSIAAGWLREDYARTSASYADAFATALYRRGFTSWLTGEVRGDVGSGLVNAGASLSLTHALLGQFDAGLAASAAGARGSYATLGWTRAGDRFSVSGAVETASAGFARRGERQAPAQFGARVAASWRDARLGALALGYATREHRDEGVDIRTISLSYAPPLGRRGDLNFALLWSDADTQALSFQLSLTQPLADGGARTVSVYDDAGRVTARLDAQRAAPNAGGLGYSFGASSGDRERLDAGIVAQSRYGEAHFELSRTDERTGLRGRFAFGIAGLGGQIFLARPLRDAFAVVDVGAPNVPVWHDGRPLGRTDDSGRLLAPNLRAYDENHLRIDVDALPSGAEIGADEIALRPRARRGVLVRMPVVSAEAGEVTIVDETGAPLPAGAVLTRARDGARFPVGADGRVYLSGVSGAEVFARANICVAQVTPERLGGTEPLICAP